LLFKQTFEYASQRVKSILPYEKKFPIIHWRSDIETPRGPALEIRPSPEQCLALGAGSHRAVLN
jgi:hypothetical protein